MNSKNEQALQNVNKFMQDFKESINSNVDLYSLLESKYIDKDSFYKKVEEEVFKNYILTGEADLNQHQFKKIYTECFYENAKDIYELLLNKGWITVENGKHNLTKEGKKNLKI